MTNKKAQENIQLLAIGDDEVVTYAQVVLVIAGIMNFEIVDVIKDLSKYKDAISSVADVTKQAKETDGYDEESLLRVVLNQSAIELNKIDGIDKKKQPFNYSK